jgi:hypothetical protein
MPHQLATREQLSWFDALIAEAAILSRCSVLYSEDFGHGRRIAGLDVVNPLRGLDKATGGRASPSGALTNGLIQRTASIRIGRLPG